jgi:protein TonB
LRIALRPTFCAARRLTHKPQGTVILNGVIGTDGHFKRLDVLAGPPMLQQAVVDTLRQWVYTPFLLEGSPVEVETDISVVFALQR